MKVLCSVLEGFVLIESITGSVHVEHRREDPVCGVAPTVLHCAVAVFPA